MHHPLDTRLALAAALPVMGGTAAALAADPPAVDKAAVDKAFDALKTYDYGQDRNLLKPIDDAVIATHGDAAARQDLEKRLADVLKGNVTRDAADYACRTLRVIGTAESVPALAGLLAERDLSHMARYALQAIPVPEAAKALRDALATLNAELKVGVIGSLGVRRDAESVPALAALLERRRHRGRLRRRPRPGNDRHPDGRRSLGPTGQATARRRRAGRYGQLSAVRRAASGRRLQSGSEADLSISHGGKTAQARSPGRGPRSVERRRQERITRRVLP